MPRHPERGQAILLLVISMSIFLLGALALAIDGSQLYIHRQMAQAAADAAAQAGIMSIFDGTNLPATGAGFSTSAAFTCTSSSTNTPCKYASNNGFGTSADTVTVEFPASVTGVSGLSSADPVNLIRVTVQRTVNTTLMRLLGSNSSTIKAVATAAILQKFSPVPIIITHPKLSQALSVNGTTLIRICGGPKRSIQVNSDGTLTTGGRTTNSPVSIVGTSSINLSKAGPADDGACNTGTGADFGLYGPPAVAPTNISLGTTGRYIEPASPILDPLANVAQPSVPATALGPANTSPGTSGCPATASGCLLYSPGNYASGLTVPNKKIALFKPGIYYMSSGGFNMGPNTQALMATGFANDGATGSGMMVFVTGNANADIVSFNASAGSAGPGEPSVGITLKGADDGSTYKGILFFEDRGATAHNGAKSHSIQGGGNISLSGTLYFNSTLGSMNATNFQELSIQGNSSSSTIVRGEIIAGVLTLGGGGTIQMNLNAASNYLVRQIALVK